MSIYCNFDNLDTVLRDQLVIGLKDAQTRMELFKETELNLKKATQIAVALESAQKNAKTAENMTTRIETVTEEKRKAEDNESVHFVEGRPQYGRDQQRGQQTRERTGALASGNQRASNTRQVRRSDGPVLCFCCAEPNHFARYCSLRGRTCTNCNRKGHIEKACRKQEGRNRPVKYLEESEDGEEEEEEENGLDNEFLMLDALVECPQQIGSTGKIFKLS